MFYKIYTKTSQILNKIDVTCNIYVTTEYKYKRRISFICRSATYGRNGSCAKLNWCPSGITLHGIHCVHTVCAINYVLISRQHKLYHTEATWASLLKGVEINFYIYVVQHTFDSHMRVGEVVSLTLHFVNSRKKYWFLHQIFNSYFL